MAWKPSNKYQDQNFVEIPVTKQIFRSSIIHLERHFRRQKKNFSLSQDQIGQFIPITNTTNSESSISFQKGKKTFPTTSVRPVSSVTRLQIAR